MRRRHLAAFAASLIFVFTAVAGPASSSQSFDPLRDGHGVIVDGREPPTIRARSWIVVDAQSGDVLAAKRAHDRFLPASTLKTLTALTLIPRLDQNDEYRVRWEDAHVMGSAVGIVPGSKYTIDELFYGLMLPSGNDAARALASANGGPPLTVRQMNATARRVGALDTTAVNPTGLDAEHQLSSAFDLAIFAREGLENRNFRRYVSTISTTFPAQEPKRANKKRDSYMIYNQNPLLINGYRGILGVKTGYTTEAGRTFVAAAERGGRTLIVSLMGIIEPTDVAAERLLEWGWNHGQSVEPVGSLEAPDPQHVDTPSPTAKPLAQPLGDGSTEADAGSSALSIVLWLAAGLAMIGVGWWLQRRHTRPR